MEEEQNRAPAPAPNHHSRESGNLGIIESEQSRAPAMRDRGLTFQAVGFAIVGCAGTIIYHTFAGSEHLAYQLFAIAVTKFYWAFAVTLAAIFDGVRKMFETVQEIRRAARQKVIAKARAKGLKEGRAEGIAEGHSEAMRHVQSRMEREGLPPDTIDRILNGHRNGGDR